MSGIELIPLHGSRDAATLAADEDTFHLTGYGRISAPERDEWQDVERLRVLEAAMTFAQQRHVFITKPIVLTPGDSLESLLSSSRLGRPLAGLYQRTTFGPALPEETWAPTSRSEFLRLALTRFASDDRSDVLRYAFFRQVEIWRLSTRFVELHHFLAFSGLEMLARASGPYESQRNAAVPISEFLAGLGFQVTQAEVQLWTDARNNAFHRGLLSAPARDGSGEIRLGDQLFPLTVVLADAVLKCLGFDDGHINWNRWRDRMPF